MMTVLKCFWTLNTFKWALTYMRDNSQKYRNLFISVSNFEIFFNQKDEENSSPECSYL